MSQELQHFETTCFHCHSSFHVAEAQWCDCVVRESTIVCPDCGHCFCKAPVAFKTAFWQEAPASIVGKRIRSLRRDGAPTSQTGKERTGSDAPLVLVIDDSRTVRFAARNTLEDAGYRVAEAADAVEGLRLVHEKKPALVISDALMPRMDGREMCRIIKSDPRTSGTSVVLMTALYTASRYKTEAMTSFRADDYLAKPVTAEHLLQVVAKLLFGEPSAPSHRADALQAGAAA